MKIKTNGSMVIMLIYILSGTMFMLPLLKYGVSERAGFGLYLGIFLILVLRRKWFPLFCYMFIVMINISMSHVPLKLLDGKTVTGLVNSVIVAAFMLFFVLSRGFRNNFKNRYWRHYILWIFLCITVHGINALLFGLSIPAILWQLSPAYFSVIMIYMAQRKAEYVDEILLAIIASSILFTAVAYVELFEGKTFFYSLWTGEERYRHGILRVGSTLEDSNILGLSLLLPTFLLCTNKIRGLIGKHISYVLICLFLTGIVITGSRMALVALVTGAAVSFWTDGRTLKRFIVMLGVLAGVYLAPYIVYIMTIYEAASSGQRIYLLGQAVSMWFEEPVFGIGINQFMKRSGWLTMNEFSRQLVELGIFAFIIYCTFYIYFIKAFLRNRKSFNSRERHDAGCMLAAIIAYMINSLSLDTFGYYMFWIIPALSFFFFGYYRRSCR